MQGSGRNRESVVEYQSEMALGCLCVFPFKKHDYASLKEGVHPLATMQMKSRCQKYSFPQQDILRLLRW